MTNFISGKLGNTTEIPLSRGGAEGDGVVSKLVNAAETPPPANAGYSSAEENLSEVVVQDGAVVVGGGVFAHGDTVVVGREHFVCGDHTDQDVLPNVDTQEIPLSRGGAEGDGVVSTLVNAAKTPPPANAGYSSVEENLSEVVVQDGEGAVVGGERFVCGDQEVSATRELFGDHLGFVPTSSLRFSLEAAAVFEASSKLWRYYHEKCDDASVGRFGGGDGASPLRGVYNANASLYDIREYFQGRNGAGKMNNKSLDEEYNKLIGNLRSSLKLLALKIQPKVYEYGFLRG